MPDDPSRPRSAPPTRTSVLVLALGTLSCVLLATEGGTKGTIAIVALVLGAVYLAGSYLLERR